MNTLSKRTSFTSKLFEDVLEINFSVESSDWERPDVTVTDKDLFLKIFGAGRQHWFEENLPTLSDFDVTLGSLNSLLGTALLMPGRNAIKVDAGVGLYLPNDYFLVGKVGKLR